VRTANKFKIIVKKILEKLGYAISRSQGNNTPESPMSEGLKRMKDLHINPSSIVDIGAAAGTWTEKALRYWPNAKYNLVEPLEERRTSLLQLKSVHPNLNIHIAVAGAETGEIGFNVSSDLDGSGIYDSNNRDARSVPMVTIDEIVGSEDCEIAIKLDTHGFEVPILAGALNTLSRTSLLIIEVYGFHISPTCLLFHELSSLLDRKGFRLIDIVDIMRRPGDQAFWQCDAFYIRKDHSVFKNNGFT
jgi:FkbM family methyltransferase